MSLEMVPVVEFEPSHLGVENFSSLQDSGEWPDHWARRLDAWRLRPIQPGSWFVATAEFSSDLPFELLVKARLMGDAGPDGLPTLDQLGPIPGGLAFVVDGQIHLEPGCCCDLSDLDDWRAAFDKRENSLLLTIGHGVFWVGTADGLTTVKVESERAGGEPLLLRYPEHEFEVGLVRAAAERERFAALLEAYLEKRLTPNRSQEISRRLATGR